MPKTFVIKILKVSKNVPLTNSLFSLIDNLPTLHFFQDLIITQYGYYTLIENMLKSKYQF
ncbi:hypothetical protein GSP_09480 [Staphylococcus pseudintermedius]|nr:hypothetical protein GSP_09480 [Staphylococcus pseudintermedius]